MTARSPVARRSIIKALTYDEVSAKVGPKLAIGTARVGGPIGQTEGTRWKADQASLLPSCGMLTGREGTTVDIACL